MTSSPSGQRRVLLYLHRMAVNPSGVHRYAAQIAAALSRQAGPDMDVEMWSGAHSGAAEVPGVDVRHPKVHRRLLHASWTLTHRPLLERITGAGDVAHLLTPAFPLPTRMPLVVTIHDLIPLTDPQWHPPHHRFAFERSVRYAADHADRLMTGSHTVADDMQRLLGVDPERIRVVYNSIDASFYERLEGAVLDEVCRRYDVERGRFVLTVGELSPRKNLETLLAAWRTMSAPPVLLVAGAIGPRAGDVAGDVTAAGLDAVVRVVGRVPEADLRALMQAAGVLVHPSLYEGFGLTPLEAMASETPVVVSDRGSLPEVVGDAAVILPALDAQQWAAEVTRVLQDPAWSAELVERGRLRTQQFTWDAAARALLDVYAELWS